MPDQLPNITFRRGGHPNPRKTILHQQVEDVQSIPVVCLLFAHHRRADLRRITNPQFMPIVTEHLFEPLRGEGGFYADADGSRQCSIKPLGLARAMLQAARYKFARRGIHHCDFLKPCVKITSYNQHSRSAPFLRALVEETATKSTRPEGAYDVIQLVGFTGKVPPSTYMVLQSSAVTAPEEPLRVRIRVVKKRPNVDPFQPSLFALDKP